MLKTMTIGVLVVLLSGCADHGKCTATDVHRYSIEGSINDNGFYTDVNYVCEDGHSFTSQKRGYWSLEELNMNDKKK